MSVIDVGKSMPVSFDWDLSIYNLPERNAASKLSSVGVSGPGMGSQRRDAEPNAEAGDGSTSSTGGDGGEGKRGATEALPPQGGGGRGRVGPGGAVWLLNNYRLPLFRVEVGEFVAFSTRKSSQSSVGVGKLLSLTKRVDGNEVELHWYMLESVDPNASRSRYGRAGWTPEFCVVGGERERSMSFEHVAGFSCKFAKLTKSIKLSSHVWPSIAESAQAQDMEEDDE